MRDLGNQRAERLDRARIAVALERAGGWVGQPNEKAILVIHLACFQGHLPPIWFHHIAGGWHGMPGGQN